MNERIKELRQQAEKSAQFLSNSNESKQRIVMETFAELIVLECARWLSTREFASPEALKHHFGVK